MLSFFLIAPPRPMNTQNISYADELVKEYLIFRGFIKTANLFDQEKKSHKLKGFQVSVAQRQSLRSLTAT